MSCLVAGPSGCGKSSWTKAVIEHQLIDPPPERILWYYGEWQPMYEDMPNVEFIEGLPDVKTLDPKTRNLVVIDDQMEEASKQVTTLFTKGSAHRNTSVMHLVQNAFHHKGRTISLNSKFLVLFKNPRDASIITHLAKQMYPGRIKFLQEAFADATARPWGYLLFDLRQETPDHLRLTTNVLPGETQYVYLRKV